MIVAFRSALNLNRMIFTEDRMKFIDSQILNQLKDIAVDVSKRKCKNTMGQMFCIEAAFVKKHYLLGLIKKLNHKI